MLKAINLLTLYMSKNVVAHSDLIWSLTETVLFPQDYDTAHMWRSLGDLSYWSRFFETGSLLTHHSLPVLKLSKIPISPFHILSGAQRLETSVTLCAVCPCVLRTFTLATDPSPQLSDPSYSFH